MANIVTQTLVATNTKNRFMVLMCRVVKGVMTTFGSTLMVNAALTDILSGKEYAVAMSTMAAVTGAALVTMPFAEGMILARSKHDTRIPYLACATLAASQLLHNIFFLPETLEVARRKTLNLKVLLTSP